MNSIVDLDESDLTDFVNSSPASTHPQIENDDLCDEFYRLISSNISKCKYLDSDTVNFKTFGGSLILMHLNIRSLHKNFDPFFNFIQSLDLAPDVICLTETRIKDQPLINLDIPGYSFVHVNSETAAGGVAIYISNIHEFF